MRPAGRRSPRAVTQRKSRLASLDEVERIEFIGDVVEPIACGMPGGVWFIRTFDRTDLTDPVGAAQGRPVFELTRADHLPPPGGGTMR